MKKILSIFLLLALVLSLASCAGKAGVGPKLSYNIARVYTPETRESRFVMNGEPIEGSIIGKAYFTAAADGKTSLAWVDTVLYFVSEKGVDSLGTGISNAEISFDGQTALYFMDGKIMRYSLETRSSEVLDENVDSVIQFATSPGGETVMFTASYKDDDAQYRTKIYRDGALTPALGDVTAVVLAVSDDAKTIWYSDIDAGFCVEVNGERKVVSTECGAATNYNFTRDLGEVIFSTNDKKQVFYRLKDGRTTELGENFGYTLKTDVYGISDVNMFCYTNDIDTFDNGLFMTRETTDDGYLYTIGLIDGKGELTVLAENAYKYEVSSDGKKLFWLGVNGLSCTDMKGKTVRISDTVTDFVLDGGGKKVYYISVSTALFSSEGTERSTSIDTGVTSVVSASPNTCAYIKEDGTLWTAGPSAPVKALDGAVRFDKRCGQLLVYVGSADAETFTLYISKDGTVFNKFADGVEP